MTSCHFVLHRLVSALDGTCIKYIVSFHAYCFDPYELSCLSYELLLFQIFQLTTLVIRGPATHGEQFIFGLECVTIKGEEVRGVLLCLQDFVRSPHFKQRNCFSETGLTMLVEFFGIADSITSIPVYASWSVLESAFASQVITDLCACWDRVVLRRRTANDSSERWYHGGTTRSETASRPGVRISDVVEQERIEYVPVAAPALDPPGPSKIPSSSSKRKRKFSRCPVKLPRRFEFSGPPVSPQRRSLLEDPSFAIALATPAFRGKSRRSRHDRHAAPVFQLAFP